MLLLVIILNRQYLFTSFTIIHQFFSLSCYCTIWINFRLCNYFYRFIILIDYFSIKFSSFFLFSLSPIFYSMFLGKVFTIFISMVFSALVSIRFRNLKEIRNFRLFIIKFLCIFKFNSIIRVKRRTLFIILLFQIRIW